MVTVLGWEAIDLDVHIRSNYAKKTKFRKFMFADLVDYKREKCCLFYANDTIKYKR